MSTKISKEDLKSPDQVTQTLRQGFVWTTTHSKIVVLAIIVFAVVGVGASITSYLSEKNEQAQQEKYFLLEKEYLNKKQGFEEALRAGLNPNSKAPVDASKKASGDLEKDYGTVVRGLESFVAEAPKSKAAQMAALHLSDVYLSYKKHSEALAALKKVESGLDNKAVLTALVWMQIGNVLSDQNDCQGAIGQWQKISDNKSLAFAHDEAKLRMGLCYEVLNDAGKAEQLYTEVSKKQDASTANFAASREAEKYLRLLKAKKNL
ncbi:MAG: hypothetical protein AAGB31_15290 [Bdellovibrio sp.]